MNLFDLLHLGFFLFVVLFLLGVNLCCFIEDPIGFLCFWVGLPVVVGLILFPVLCVLYVLTCFT
jgi:hypothetical protein